MLAFHDGAPLGRSRTAAVAARRLRTAANALLLATAAHPGAELELLLERDDEYVSARRAPFMALGGPAAQGQAHVNGHREGSSSHRRANRRRLHSWQRMYARRRKRRRQMVRCGGSMRAENSTLRLAPPPLRTAHSPHPPLVQQRWRAAGTQALPQEPEWRRPLSLKHVPSRPAAASPVRPTQQSWPRGTITQLTRGTGGCASPGDTHSRKSGRATQVGAPQWDASASRQGASGARGRSVHRRDKWATATKRRPLAPAGTGEGRGGVGRVAPALQPALRHC